MAPHAHSLAVTLILTLVGGAACGSSTVVEDGTSDDGTSDDGTADDGTADDGTADDGTADDGTADDGTADDGSSVGSGGPGGGETTGPASGSSGGCVDAPACEAGDRIDDTCRADEEDCYSVTGCVEVWCRRTVGCFNVEACSDVNGEDVTVRDGQACAVEGEVCDGIDDCHGTAHCTAGATCEQGYWVDRGWCEDDEEYEDDAER